MNAAVESIKAPKRALDESDISDFEEDKQDDPWQGTQLQRFITKSPKKDLTGLTGLQGVISHTRAAAGYSKPEKNRPLQPTKLFAPVRPNAGASKPTPAPVAADSTSDTDDDDLDAPSRLPSRPPPRIPSRPPTAAAKSTSIQTSRDPPPRRLPNNKTPAPHPAKPPQRSFLDTTPRATPTSVAPSSKVSRRPVPPDPSPPIKPEPVQEPRSSSSEVRQWLKARREREEQERRKSGGGIGVDEIPVFLV